MENRFEDSDHFKGSMEILQQHYPDPEELIKGLMQMAHSMELLSGKKTPVLLPNITLIDDRTRDIRKIARFLKRFWLRSRDGKHDTESQFCGRNF